MFPHGSCITASVEQVSLALGPVHFRASAPGQFTYLEEQGLDYGFARLARLLPRHPGGLGGAVVLGRESDRDRGIVEHMLGAWCG